MSKFSNWLKSSFRLVLTIMVCGLIFISSSYPAQALTSKVTDGEVSLNKIQAKTDDVANSNPREINEVTEEAQKGLNGLQGRADRSKYLGKINFIFWGLGS